MFKLVFLFVLFAFCFSNAQSVSGVVSDAVSYAQGEFASIIVSVASVAFFVVVAIVGVFLAVKLFGKNTIDKRGNYRRSWNWEGYNIKTDKDFYFAWEKKYGG